MMLGLLLARSGVDVIVLEKHADFLRDFRGDTIHPSTLELIHELGLLDELLRLPHQQMAELRGEVGGVVVAFADFTGLPTRCRFIAFMPQWDFLDFLARHAAAYPSFRLSMETEATGLLEEDARVVGVRAMAPEGPLEVRADLVVAADGRHSALRQAAGLDVVDLGAPMDVVWFRLPRRPGDRVQALGRLVAGRILVAIDRGAYWQCGYVIAKGTFDDLRRRGLDAFRQAVAEAAPFAADRVGQIRDWAQASLLTVRVDRLVRWYRPGFLCIGDAAHAMSPIGGVGINLAIQDAVAAANVSAAPLRERRLTPAHLAAVERRRRFPTRVTQWVQLTIQRRLIVAVLGGRAPSRPPLFVRLLGRRRWLRRLAGRLIGLGVRPEHIRTPACP